MQLMFVKLLVITVLFGKASCAIDWAASIAAAGAAATAVTSGASVLQGLAGAPGYSVVCSFEVENWTKYPLMYPASHINGGILKSSPVTVQPGKREMFVAHKTGHTATGTYGTASWLIQSKNKRAVIMWSCPYSFDFHSNWLGVGLTTYGQTTHKDWFNQMYNGKSGNGLQFKRKDYYYSTATISVKDGEFEITGTMGTSHKAKARIIVRPLKKSDLAGPLRVKIVSRSLFMKNVESENQQYKKNVGAENANRIGNVDRDEFAITKSNDFNEKDEEELGKRYEDELRNTDEEELTKSETDEMRSYLK